MPGVYINQASSKPGSDGATIRIRGVGTMSSSSPMVLVDGMEYSLNELNPGDIETISVLKDASASIYGSKAANGVILITTKQAKKGAPVVKLSANFGIQSATYVPDVVTDPIQYMNMRNQAELNEGKLTVTYNRDDILEYEEGMKHDKYIYPASDWYDLCYQNGFLQQYNARVSGGTDKISYSLGGGYMNQRGIMVANDDAERFSWDMKINAQVTKRLKVGVSLLGNLRYNTDPIYGVSTTVNVINRALPIFGTGTALVPWSLFLLFKREWGHALILFGLYLLCYFLREFTEAHLMGKKMGLSPLETLAAIYVGLQLFGLFGFLLGPIGLLIIKDFVEEYGEADEGADAH